MMRRALFLVSCLAWALPAHPYCVNNELSARNIRVEQDSHPDKMRAERTLQATLKPGERRCCESHNLDCNPEGRRESIVKLAITILGNPAYTCGDPVGSGTHVKVTGSGSVRVQPRPRGAKSTLPYIVRVRTHDKDITGPRGFACPETRPRGK